MNETIQHVDQAIRSRHSMRNFLDKPVPQALVRELLELAACAPSSTNVQPWKVYALCGADKAALSAAVMARFEQGETDGREVDCYPKEWQEPWLSRRRAVGLGLYKLLGIGKEDKARMKAQHARNFTFFDAPVGLLLTIDRRLGQGMLIDCGLFLGNLTIAAKLGGVGQPQQLGRDDGILVDLLGDQQDIRLLLIEGLHQIAHDFGYIGQILGMG